MRTFILTAALLMTAAFTVQFTYAAGSASAPTAEQQSTTKTDTELTRKIRADIVKDGNLSMRAHNVKIITRNGEVHLRGAVANASEQQRVEMIAKMYAGDNRVVNETTVERK